MLFTRWPALGALCALFLIPLSVAAQSPTDPEPEPSVDQHVAEAVEKAKKKVKPVQEESDELETAQPEPEKRPQPSREVGQKAAPEPDSEDTVPEAWWHSGYLIDYGLAAVGVLGFTIGHYTNPRATPLFGAEFDFTDPADSINFRDERISRLYLPDETVPTKHLVYMVPGVLAFIALGEGAIWAFTDDGSPQIYHDTVVGFIETVLLTLGTTEILKSVVGRLRPDFADRVLLQFCMENPEDELCADFSVPGDSKSVEAIFDDGRRSFPSGHSSIGMNIYTYLALVVGGRFVWGDDATRLSRGLGLFLQTAAIGTGLFIATSRLDDGRHHDTDVFVGALLGFGMANLSYWRRFGADGLPLPRQIKKAGVSWRLTPGPGTGLGIQATF